MSRTHTVLHTPPLFHISTTHLYTGCSCNDKSVVYWFKVSVPVMGQLAYALPQGEGIFGLCVRVGDKAIQHLLNADGIPTDEHVDYQTLCRFLAQERCVEENCTINHAQAENDKIK